MNNQNFLKKLIALGLLVAILLGPLSAVQAADSVEIQNVESQGEFAPGGNISFKVTVKVNDGQLLQSRGDMLRNTDGNLYGHWPHIAVLGTVNAGQSYTFISYGGMVAPTAVGSYQSKWRVWRDGNWAGQEIPISFEVRVGGGGNPIPTAKSNVNFNTVAVGDIIVARTDSTFSDGLAYIVGGYWTHAAIVVEKRDGVPYIAESYASVTRPPWWPNWLPGKAGDARPGVVKKSLYNSGLYKKAEDIAILRVRSANDAQRQQTAEYAMAPGRADQDGVEPWEGKPYNWNFVDKETEDAYYCSQLVWAAYKHVGIDLDSNQSMIGIAWRYDWTRAPVAELLAYAVLPDDIYGSPNVEKVTQAKTDSGRTFRRTVIYIFSPGDLYLVGQDGKVVGTDPTTKAQVNEIPDAFYTGPSSEPEYISIRDMTDNNWQLHVVGTGSGPYHLVFEDVNQTRQPIVLTGTTSLGVDAIYDLKLDASGILTAAPQDQLPPTTTHSLQATIGLANWFVSPVTVTLSAIDNPENGVGVRQTDYSLDGGLTWLVYSQPFVLTDGIHTLQYRSIDHVNNAEQIKSAMIKVDTVAPIVNAWTDQPTYTRVQPYTVHYTAYDPEPGSGVATLSATFNGQSVTNNQVVDLRWSNLGSYSLAATAEDNAGWVTTHSATFELVASLESLQATVGWLCQDGYLKNQGICNSLAKKLDAALAARDRGQRITAQNVLNAFQNEVNAQTGKAIKPEAARILLMDSDYVIKFLR